MNSVSISPAAVALRATALGVSVALAAIPIGCGGDSPGPGTTSGTASTGGSGGTGGTGTGGTGTGGTGTGGTGTGGTGTGGTGTGGTGTGGTGCTPLSDAQLQAIGYEPVRAHGAVGDNFTDDSNAIQAAIDAANEKRRVVYFHPGTYVVSKQLLVKQDVLDTKNNDGSGRYGNVLLGSQCGSERPTIRLADEVANATSEPAISAEPFAVITLWRLTTATSPPDDTDGGHDWNQVVRNLKIVLGKNPGAVGVRHRGAEGSSIQDVLIDATGGFAGLYQVNSSGGYTYNMEVVGGKYGIYAPNAQGGSTLLTGIKLSGQEKTPIAWGHYAPLILVGFDITHHGGPILSSITGSEGSFTVPGELRAGFHDCSGHVSLVDGRIEVTGSPPAILANTNRSVYLKNVYVRGAATVLSNAAPGGGLIAAQASSWSRVTEYAYSGAFLSLYGERSKLVAGTKTEDTYHDGALIAASSSVTISQQATPPSDLLSRHLHESTLCNVEGTGVVFVTDHGADPSDPADDTAGIQAAINAAKSGSNVVFLPAGSANASGSIPRKYVISGTLELSSETRLCGVTRYSSILDASAWKPTTNRPVIQSPNDKGASTAIADFKIELPTVQGSYAQGYQPHVYAILWQTGRNSVSRDVWYLRAWGDPGDRRSVVITNGGGGKFYGVTNHAGYPPPDVDPSASVSRPYKVGGNLIMSPEARHLYISGTTEPLTFYPFHLQHLTPPEGAQGEIVNAANVTFYASKAESASVPGQMQEIIASNPADLIPAWMRITGSSNISFIGYEGLSEQAAGRGLIEISGSSDITIANMGRRDGGTAVSEDQWFFVSNATAGGTSSVKAAGFLAFFRH